MIERKRRRGRKEGSIFRRGDGRWVGSLSLGYVGGKRKRRVVYGATKGDVQRALRRLQSRLDAGTLTDAGRVTVGEHLRHWLDHKANLKPTTRARYEQLAEHMRRELATVRLADLRRAHIERLVKQCSERLEPRGVRNVLRVLSGCLKDAVAHGLIVANPAAGVQPPRGEAKELMVLDAAQSARLLAAGKETKHYAFLTTALSTGARMGELLGLTWPDVNLDAGTLTIRRSVALVQNRATVQEPKTKHSRRTITLPPFAVEALREHQARQLAAGLIRAPVFCNEDGGWRDYRVLSRRWWKPLVKRAGFPTLRFHDLRHTHASQLLSAGASVAAVAKRLGHANPSITLMIYSHAMPSDDAELAQKIQQIQG